MGTTQIIFFILFAINFVDCKAKKKARQEIITVTQHTASPRTRRDIYTNPEGLLNGDDFPDTMDFTLHLKESDYMIHLSKHVTPQDVKLNDRNGEIKFDSMAEKTQFAIYQEVETFSSMIVECLGSSGTCTLEGSFFKGGSRWLLQSLKDVPGKYNVTEVPDAYDPNRAKKLTPPGAQETGKEGLLDKILQYFTKDDKRKKRDSPVIWGQNTETGDQTRDERSIPEIFGGGKINHQVQKRAVHTTTTCNVIEFQAFVDASVYDYYYLKELDDHAAKVAIYKDLLQLFGQTDLRYKCLINVGICIRIYLKHVVIEENAGSDFITESSLGPDFYDAYTSIFDVGLQKFTGDLAVGFTRLKTDFDSDPLLRGVAFGDVLCNPHFPIYEAILQELKGDDDDLLLAHMILYTMNVLSDGDIGCSDFDSFVGALYVLPPTPGNEHNPWLFSSCSIAGIQAFLNSRSGCLKSGDIDEKRLEAESLNRMLPGRMFDFDHLCQETFGFSSFACQAAGENSIFDIPDICDQGVYCYVYGDCVNRTRVPIGSRCGCNKYCFKNKCELGPTVALGEACTGCCTCSEPNSNCDCETQTCTCNEGFYEAPNGTCIPGGGINGTCSPDRQGSCPDPNTECSDDGFCVCSYGFVECTGFGCQPYQGINQYCECNTQCDWVYGSCINNKCKCDDLTIYYVDNCGVCRLRVENNGNCSGEAQCLDPKAFCDPHTEECVCSDKTYDNNGTCTDLIPLGDACTLQGSCEDSNAECLYDSCTCIPGFFEKNGVCIAFRYINEECTCDVECMQVGGFCDTSGVCKCNETTEVVDECGICQNKSLLGQPCAGEHKCLDENAICNVDDICECAQGFFNNPNGWGQGSMGVCEELIPLLMECPFPGTCADPNAECVGTCQCISGFLNCVTDFQLLCLPQQALNEPCNCDEQCTDVNGMCTQEGNNAGGLCKCPDNETYYVDLCGICQLRPILGEPCNDLIPCLGSSTFCSPKTHLCTCGGPNYDSNQGALGGSCESLIPLLMACPFPGTCADPNAECVGTCQCKSGFLNCVTDFQLLCLPQQAINEPCNCDEQCTDVNGFCTQEGNNAGGLCKCPDNDTYYVDLCGICQLRPSLGDPCTDVTPCFGDFAFCSPMSMTCVCVGPTININGICEPLVPLNGSCTANNQCEDENAVCAWDNTCQCADGFVDCPNDQDPKCLAEEAISEGCECDQQCYPVQGECLGDPGVCKCPMPSEMYTVDDCGICQLKRALGQNCSDAVPCLDEKAYCDPCDGICVCINGYFENTNGTCEKKADLGEKCSSTIECADCNANCVDYFCQCGPGYTEQNGICDCAESPFDCGAPPTEDNGFYELVDNSTTLGSSAMLVCCEGYEVGVNMISCTSSGWSTQPNTCQLKTCDLPTIQNGMYVCGGSNTVPVGSQARLECDQGYGPSSDDTCIVCQPDGTFSSASATCIRDCGIPEYEFSIGYYVLNQSRTLEGDIATLFCCNRYYTAGTVQITCQASGEWSCPSAICCQENWTPYDGNCYFVKREHLTRNEARSFCNSREEGSRLLIIDSTTESAFAKSFMSSLSNQPNTGAWFDLVQNGTNGNEVWESTGEALNIAISDWASGEPNDSGGRQSGSMLWRGFGYKWTDIEAANDYVSTAVEDDNREGYAFCEVDLDC